MLARYVPDRRERRPRRTVRGRRHPEHPDRATMPGRPTRAQSVLTNGGNVGARAGRPDRSGLRSRRACRRAPRRSNVQPGQGLRLQTRQRRHDPLHAPAPDRRRRHAGAAAPGRRRGRPARTRRPRRRYQGGWDTKYTQGEILLPPGTRADVVAAIPVAPTDRRPHALDEGLTNAPGRVLERSRPFRSCT